MPNFRGFSTINQHKKFSLVDLELIKRDLLNAFLIREGTMPGIPSYGTNIWSYVFEQNDASTKNLIEAEVTRIVNQDPRIELENVKISTVHNTVIVEMEVTILPFSDSELFFLKFNEESLSATIT